jgi:hypothetical protein
LIISLWRECFVTPRFTRAIEEAPSIKMSEWIG